ncbi:hypothetical protein [Nostoc sp. CMAA1605]|uniref:hypothetical protein n=1 Tax=Nostoc sp. CMAA1605 TaxID=2055159 RepID=UPI001F22737A|nr:hypothetical protein [Nostoc sp. CMAA1605]
MLRLSATHKLPLDKAVIYRVQMTQYQLQGRNAEAIAIQRQSLQLLGWTMPTEPEIIQASLDAEIATVQQFFRAAYHCIHPRCAQNDRFQHGRNTTNFYKFCSMLRGLMVKAP